MEKNLIYNTVNRTGCIIILLFVLSIASCKKEDEIDLRDTLPEQEEETFTAGDATTAFEAFNQHLYDPEAKLFSTTTDGGGFGAIWTQAIMWDVVMNAYKRTGRPSYKKMIADVYQGGYEEYDGYNWENHVEWFIWDDMMWWIISLARAHEITGNETYLEKSIAGFEHVWEGSYDPVNGGMEWAWTQPGKTACINYPTVIGAMTLHNITGDPVYVERAKEIYSWASENLFDPDDGKVADHKVGDNPTNWTTHVYNQATCIGAAVMLYLETKEQRYLEDAILAADYTRDHMCNANGILPYEGGTEQGIYTAIFAQYMIRLIEDCGQDQYLDWLRKNIDVGWGNRDIARGLTYKDYTVQCPGGPVSCYDASGIVALMQVIPPVQGE